MKRILVIKLGALGDFVQAFGPFEAIRHKHAADEVSLLTTKPFVELAKASPWFNHVLTDVRPAWWDVRALLLLRRQLAGFDFVYDLQTSRRSSRYFYLAGRPPWSGIARGASCPHDNPRRDYMHTRDRQREQLAQAGVAHVGDARSMEWFYRAGVHIPAPYAVLVPGASVKRGVKRWPVENYGILAQKMWACGVRPVLIGSRDDRPLAQVIRGYCEDVLDLTGKTRLIDLGGIMRRALFAVGNDTGPMHMAAAAGCRSVVLFSRHSNPALCAPTQRHDGRPIDIIREYDLATLSVYRVEELIKPYL